MKPTFDIPTTPLDNTQQFTDAFFQRFQQAPATIQLTPDLSKTYAFPTFYGDVTCAMGIFLCDYEAARAMLPHPAMHPVRMTKGRSLVIFSCYHYKHVMGIPAYNEIAMTLPILAGPGRDWPVLPMIAGGLFPQMGYYVFGMPVTSKENQLRGNNIWGLPKVTHEIDLGPDGGDCVTVAKEENGTPYFTLRVPMSGTKTDFDASGWLYSKLGDRYLRSQTNFKGTFNVTKHMGALFTKGAKPDRPYLQIGDGPSAAILRSLQVEEQPFQFRYAQTMNSVFDLPQPDWKAPW
jgi:hypothetical protein